MAVQIAYIIKRCLHSVKKKSTTKMVCQILISFLSILTISTVLYLKLCLACPGKHKRHKVLSNLKDIHHLLSPPLTTKTSMLEARAVANIRLVHAFGLNTSTFTSASTEVHQFFRKNVAARMKTINSIDEWKDVGDYVLRICGEFLHDNQPNEPVEYNFDEFIQVIVFKTVLFTFFRVQSTSNESSPTVNFAEVCHVTNGINKLWIVSKSPGFQKTPNLDLVRINHFLREWIEPDPDNPFTESPLEIIIPAYETMWRLVAHAYARVKLNPEYSSTFVAFSDNPTMVQFKASGKNNSSASVENIIHETLRLYPPTKRIKRALPLSWTRRLFASIGFRCFAEREIISANIEDLHTSSVWDPLHAHEFDALRHRNVTEEQKQSFLPFGYGPLKCIAMEFAPRYCATILGSLLKIEDTVLTRGGSHGEREGWQGWKFKVQSD